MRGLLSGSASGRLLFAVPRPWNNRQFYRLRHRHRDCRGEGLRTGRGPNGARRRRVKTRARRAGQCSPRPGVEGAGPRPHSYRPLGKWTQCARLGYELTDATGSPEMLPIMQSLYIDTDPEELDAALEPDPPHRLAAPMPTAFFPAVASTYLKPPNGEA